MNIEFEATFPNVSISQVQTKLEEVGAKLLKPRTLYRRVAFNLPPAYTTRYNYARVRDEGDSVTMTIKDWEGEGIEAQKELELIIDDFETGIAFLEKLGCAQKAYQETYRELWELGGVHITIDEWPFLEPFVEIEGSSEDRVKEVSEQLGFDYSQAIFGGVTLQYMEKYGISQDQIDNHTPRITFDKNPFVSE